MQVHNKLIYFMFIVATLSGCATTYTNKELRDAFKAKGLEAEETERGVVVFLPGVFFEYDKADLTPNALLKVGDIAVVTNNPGVIDRSLLIEGHTDANGSEEYNLQLSNRRAESVKNGLIVNKVAPTRMATRGFGEKYPIAQNLNPDGSPNSEGQAKNRRVEVVVKNQEP